MKRLKINFCGFWNSFDKKDNLFYNILSRHFQIEISDQPDFVICSNRGKPFEYMKYDCVRIMFMGENLSPDFTVFDYVIGFDFLNFGDRYFRLPFAIYADSGLPWRPAPLTIAQAEELLNKKTVFCNFIYRHPSSNGMRERLLHELSQYKPVVSPGGYMNNTGKKGCSWQEKYTYLEHSKFTIACDSISYPGFVTEKIVQPLQHHSIPIYYGSPDIKRDFNESAFVWCRSDSVSDIKQTIEEVIYLDTHDDAYLKMLSCCPLPRQDQVSEQYEALESFLLHIFSQSPEQAVRRVRYFCAEHHESLLKDCMKRGERNAFAAKIRKKRGHLLKDFDL